MSNQLNLPELKEYFKKDSPHSLFPSASRTEVQKPSGKMQIDDKDISNESIPTISFHSALDASKNQNTIKLVSTIFNESFGYRPDGRPYRLGPKSTAERLAATDFLLVAGEGDSGIGYLFGKEIPNSSGRVSWIESMAVLPLYRRHGIATALVKKFLKVTRGSASLGCATQNPIAALIVTRLTAGDLFIAPRKPNTRITRILRNIRQHCFDLRGCKIDDRNFRIRTGFSPLSRSDQREWDTRISSSAPFWWGGIENLPNEYEALLYIERKVNFL